MEERRERPSLECDLIMKGGITSGVVYPQAVLALKDTYRFRSIGGGSVGALAAALTAAAELGRDSDGFGKLAKEQQRFQETPGLLLELFRPPPAYKPLMDTAFEFAPLLKRGKDEGWGRARFLRESRTVLERCHPRVYGRGRLWGTAGGAGVGALLGVSLAAVLGAVVYLLFFLIAGLGFDSLGGWLLLLPIFVLGPPLLLGALFTVVGRWFGGLVLAAYNLFRLATGELPKKNFYGLCIGSGEPGTKEQPLLTDWLSELLDDLADLDGKSPGRPLTFRHLRDAAVEGKRPKEPGISLKVLSTCLNQQEPYAFPREENTFLFKKEDMERFFPAYVVRHLVEKGKEVAGAVKVKPPKGFYFLPKGDDLPVIVPVRMGISFPVLLSAVPLYTVKESAWPRYDPEDGLDAEEDLQPNLFSDGGICSNFPIHFFDSWLPRRPTFGINLTSMPLEERGDGYSTGDVRLEGYRKPRTRIQEISEPSEPWLPKPDDPDSREWRELDGVVKFFFAIVYSAISYRDNMQSRLPSYQERTVQVPLSDDEGGLNLGMESSVIGDIAVRGRQAGEKLLKGFEPERLGHHRWVRLRMLMNQIEAQLTDATGAQDLETVLRLIEEHDGDFPYPLHDEARRTNAKELAKALYELAGDCKDRHPDGGYADDPDEPCAFPRIPDEDPEPTLRVTPDV